MIKNKNALKRNLGKASCLIDFAEVALHYISPQNLIRKNISLKNDKLIIQGRIFSLNKYKKIYLIGAGKATYQMAEEINTMLGNRITAGFINVPKAYSQKIGNIIVNQAGHPYPTISGVKGTREILKIAEGANNQDLVLCLMSGGGSALMPLPDVSMSLQEKIYLTDRLLKSGADINEINIVRKHVSQIKGGRLAQAAMPATLISLYISDVVGDNLEIIASGPTILDSSTCDQALAVLQKYKIYGKKIANIIKYNETPKNINTKKVFNFLIGNNKAALQEITRAAHRKKIKVMYLTSQLQGEAREVAKVLTSIAKDSAIKHKTLIISGGETTVTVKGVGKGGRNQELVLASLSLLPENVSILSLATDGVDGITPYPVAGACACGKMQRAINKKNININKYLENNDSFSCLKQLNCLLEIGLTGSNVGDIIMLFVN